LGGGAGVMPIVMPKALSAFATVPCDFANFSNFDLTAPAEKTEVLCHSSAEKQSNSPKPSRRQHLQQTVKQQTYMYSP
jgi:hypothetical protein